ncbi:hypothetical protein [Marinibactrum halimedae]|nr:hypothetical protein [Marinibactrum halimedae]MCD9460806.1 hypothetical protein [Marinibactrum halimedae]
MKQEEMSDSSFSDIDIKLIDEQAAEATKRCRHYLRMSPTDFADFMQVKSVKTIYNWEDPTNSASPKFSHFLHLIAAIGMNAFVKLLANTLNPSTQQRDDQDD